MKTSKPNSPEAGERKMGRGRKIVNGAIGLALLSIVGGGGYVGGGNWANKHYPTREFEKDITRSQGTEENNGYIYKIGSHNFENILKENSERISHLDPEVPYLINQNEQDNKTYTKTGQFISGMSEGIRKAVPFMRTPNKSFGTRQVQDKAFINFMKKMEPEEKVQFIMKLGSITINGEKIMTSCGFADDISGFIRYIEGGKYNTEDGNDNWWGKGNGKLGFAMGLVMLDKICENEQVDISTINYKEKYETNIAKADLISNAYSKSLVSAYRATDYVRAKESCPKQLAQNIDIIFNYIKGNIKFEGIITSAFSNGNTQKETESSLHLDLPDGDPRERFSKNVEILQKFPSTTTSMGGSSTITTIEQITQIKEILKTLDLTQQKELATLLLSASFENLFFGLNYTSKVAPTIIHMNFANNTSKIKDIGGYLDKISNVEDTRTGQSLLTSLILYCLDASTISTDPDIRKTVPVIQGKYDETRNEINTIGRFTRFLEDVNNVIPTTNTTTSEQSTDENTATSEQSTNENTATPKQSTNENSVTLKTINKSITGYRVVKTIQVKKGLVPRDVVWNTPVAKSAIITSKQKDLDGKIITSNTNKARIPSSVIAAYLSKDKKTPLTESALHNLPVGINLYVIVPTN